MSPVRIDANSLVALLRPADARPLHTQLENRLRRLIRSGQVGAGSKLPGEIELATRLGLSRHTVRHALAMLVVEGLVRRERGRGGTRVLGPVAAVVARSLNSFYAFAWEVRAQGVEQHSRVLEFSTVTASEDLVRRLALVADHHVQRIVRIRTVGGEPLVMETAYFPFALARNLKADVLERASIYDELERLFGLRVTRAQETIRPIVLARSLARLLGVPTGSPAFRVERTSWAGERPIEWQEAIVRGDRFLYSVELANAG